MTDFITPTMTPDRSFRLPSLQVPLLGILRVLMAPLAVFSKVCGTVLTAYGRALELAYVAPFSRPPQKELIASEEDLEGRDPNW